MERYELSLQDIDLHYFHFTSKSNLNSIEKYGLIPKISKHAKYLEKTKKVFFVEGLDNLLVLFDCWINVYFYMPKIPFIYTLGSHFLRQRWFPQIISDCYFGILKRTKIHTKRAFKVFEKLLNESILLHLDLEEKIDFRYDDVDEIKTRNYKKRHLELMGYSPNYSSLENNVMDEWNMHCLPNHVVSKNKIRLCFINNSYELKDIFMFAIHHTKLNIKEICPALYGYLLFKKYF